MSSRDASLNAPIDAGDQGDWQTGLVDERDGQETVLSAIEAAARRIALLRAALRRLTPREQRIIAARHLGETPVTLSDLSERHGISKKRVRQIECRAIAKLERWVRGSAIAAS